MSLTIYADFIFSQQYFHTNIYLVLVHVTQFGGKPKKHNKSMHNHNTMDSCLNQIALDLFSQVIMVFFMAWHFYSIIYNPNFQTTFFILGTHKISCTSQCVFFNHHILEVLTKRNNSFEELS